MKPQAAQTERLSLGTAFATGLDAAGAARSKTTNWP